MKKGCLLSKSNLLYYPHVPPEICFKTPIYHVSVNPRNVSRPLGYVLVNWSAKSYMREVFTEIYGMFFGNFTAIYGIETIKEYLNERAVYEEKAKYFTKKYAGFSCECVKDYSQDWDFEHS